MIDCSHCRTMAELHLPGHDTELSLRIRHEAGLCDPDHHDAVHTAMSDAYRALTDHWTFTGTHWSQLSWVRRVHLSWHEDHGTDCRLGRQLRAENRA